MMKKKINHWIIGVGAASSGMISSFFPAMGKSCTGSCGSCSAICIPGILVGSWLVVSVVYRRSKEWMNRKKKLIMMLFFFLGIGIAVGAGTFRNVNDEEVERFTFQIQEEKQQVITIDLAKQGRVKYYLQPGTITLYGRGKSMLQDAEIHTKFYGVQAFLSQGSKKNIWTELKADMPLKSRGNGIVPITIEVEIPYTSTRQYEVGKAVLEFCHDNQLVNVIDFRFINSDYSP